MGLKNCVLDEGPTTLVPKMKDKGETPKQFLKRLVGHDVQITLKWGEILKGTLECADEYMNVILSNTYETKNKIKERIGDVCIRCNNIKMIEEINEEIENETN